jgi:hypothetical protein
MKTMLAILSSFITSAQAHESAVPHTHPHDVSMLPGIDLVVAAQHIMSSNQHLSSEW